MNSPDAMTTTYIDTMLRKRSRPEPTEEGEVENEEEQDIEISFSQSTLEWPLCRLTLSKTITPWLAASLHASVQGINELPATTRLLLMAQASPEILGTRQWHQAPPGFEIEAKNQDGSVTSIRSDVTGVISIQKYNNVVATVTAGFVHRLKVGNSFLYLPDVVVDDLYLRLPHSSIKIPALPATDPPHVTALEALVGTCVLEGRLETIVPLSNTVGYMLLMPADHRDELAMILARPSDECLADLDQLRNQLLKSSTGRASARTIDTIQGALLRSVELVDRFNAIRQRTKDPTATRAAIEQFMTLLGLPLVAMGSVLSLREAKEVGPLPVKELQHLKESDLVVVTKKPYSGGQLYDQLAKPFQPCFITQDKDQLLFVRQETKAGARLVNGRTLDELGFQVVPAVYLLNLIPAPTAEPEVVSAPAASSSSSSSKASRPIARLEL